MFDVELPQEHPKLKYIEDWRLKQLLECEKNCVKAIEEIEQLRKALREIRIRCGQNSAGVADRSLDRIDDIAKEALETGNEGQLER